MCMCKLLVQNCIIKDIKKEKRCSLHFCTDYRLCHIPNIKAQVLKVSDKKIVSCFPV